MNRKQAVAAHDGLAPGFSWDLGKIPFVWSMLSEPNDLRGLPHTLPFGLGVASGTGVLVQRPNAEVSGYLKRAYEQGSVLTGMMTDSHGNRRYAKSLLKFLMSAFGVEGLRGLRVLDVGSGTGYLMRLLREHGADPTGLEPGLHGQEAAREYGLRVIRDFFPSDKLEGEFDVVIVANVLEHVEQPASVLEGLKRHVHSGSRVVITVPDCEPYIAHGDISMLIHEHWSYFTRESLLATLARSGGGDAQAGRASFGGNLEAIFSLSDGCDPGQGKANVREAVRLANLFRIESEAHIERFQAFLLQKRQEGRSVGFFAPSRAVNNLALSGLDWADYRFFDDDEALHSRYFPGIRVPIESREALLGQPPDTVIIMSLTFGDALGRELTEALPSMTQVITWHQLLTGSVNG